MSNNSNNSTYFVLDTEHADYADYLADLEALSDSFWPRPSLDGLLVIAQVKSDYDTSNAAWIDDAEQRSAVVLSSNTLTEIRALINSGWTEEAGNAWKGPVEEDV